jgi:hypothetical protein
MNGVMDFFERWQTLTAGLLALAAAIVTILWTSRSERRKAAREIESLRRSIGFELRLLVRASLAAHNALQRYLQQERPITAFDVENAARVPPPAVYTSNLHRIALLEDEAMAVMVVYNILALARETLSGQFLRYLSANNIPRPLVESVARLFMDVCTDAANLLPRLRTGLSWQDALDDDLIRDIRNRGQS